MQARTHPQPGTHVCNGTRKHGANTGQAHTGQTEQARGTHAGPQARRRAGTQARPMRRKSDSHKPAMRRKAAEFVGGHKRTRADSHARTHLSFDVVDATSRALI